MSIVFAHFRAFQENQRQVIVLYTVPVKSLDTFSHVSKLLTGTVHTHTHTQIHTNTHTHIHTHIYTHTDTHAHKHKQNTGWESITLLTSRTVPVKSLRTFSYSMCPKF